MFGWTGMSGIKGMFGILGINPLLERGMEKSGHGFRGKGSICIPNAPERNSRKPG